MKALKRAYSLLTVSVADPIDRLPRTTLQLTNTMPDMPLPGGAVGGADDMENDDGLVTINSRRSYRHSHRKPASSRRSEASLPPYSRHPPRPSPGSVNYEEDAETHKSYAESEASDMTEKPSEASSSDQESQVRSAAALITHNVLLHTCTFRLFIWFEL